ncbi:MAG: DegT/DnrJ/EryC1/StrS family aminotransferase [Phycisphaerae bacterium]|nr:DegT/DnrJ/EryC1/StrS family aminotransferase [Phycisphaerae bacterium]
MNAKKTGERAKFGAAAYEGVTGKLPTPFPRTMGPNVMKYVQEVVESGLTSNMTVRFERAFAEELGVKHCIATPGCTPALEILAAAMEWEPGDEVIVSSITDYGTIAGLVHANYIPVFADTAPNSINISAETIEPCITDRTRGILVVHMTGLICDMDPINALAKKHGLMVIEDACQSAFGEYKGQLAGTLSDIAGFSFDTEKTMGADIGGALTTNNDELAERIRFVGQSRGAGMRPGFGRTHDFPGFGTRMPLCTAATCLGQLEIIRDQVRHRDKMIRLLSDLVGRIPGVKPLEIPDYMGVYSAWMFGMSIDLEAFKCTTDEFAQQLADEGIPGVGTGRYYLMPPACTFLEENARKKAYPYSTPPASREYHYADICPTATAFLENWIRWATFCEKYTEEHCELAAKIVREVAERNRKS